VRVLVTSTPGAGHVFPMVPTVLALRAAGISVRWATGQEASGWLARLGIEHLPAGLDTGPRGSVALELVPGLVDVPPAERRVLIGPTTFARVAAPAMASDLRPLMDADPPDLVLTEPCELAAPALAAARGIPHVCVGFGGLLPDEVLSAMAEQVAPVWAEEGLTVPADAGIYQHRYLHPFPASLGCVPGELPVVPVRPVGADAAVGDAPAWVLRMGSDRPLVYVTFGTEFGHQAPFEPLLTALGRLDVDVVVTLGGGAGAIDLPVVPDNVRVETFVPQRALLERAALVVSHAGSGTMLGAAAHGVPQLCLPLGADQFDNAEAVAAAGLGESLLPGEVTATALLPACADLLARPRPAVDRVAAEIAAMPAPADAVPDLVTLAGTVR
jgi:UDP:flavonoid glycosyltransferase YjiC (YdhE family)